MKWLDRLLTVLLTASIAAAVIAPRLRHHAELPPFVSAVANPLHRQVGPVQWRDVPLEDAILGLASRSRTNIIPDWNHFAVAMNAPKIQKLKMNLGEGSLRRALRTLLISLDSSPTPASGFANSPSWTIEVDESGIIRLCDDHPYHRRSLKAYDITDLISRYMGAPWDSFPQAPSSNGLFGSGSPEPNMTQQEAIDTIVRLIEETVDPNQWRDNGGQMGSIHYFDGLLLIQTHEKDFAAVEEMLATLRASSSRPHYRDVPDLDLQ